MIQETLKAIENLGKEVLDREDAAVKGLVVDLEELMPLIITEVDISLRESLIDEVKGALETMLEAQEQRIAHAERKLYVTGVLEILKLVATL